jgi:putative ABC transport system permease protein
VRQIVTENLLLAIAGALAGLAATALTLGTIVSILPPNIPRLDMVGVHLRVFVFTLAAAVVAGLVSSLVPILRTNRLSPGRALGGGGRSSERRSSLTRRGLVIVEVGLSIVVLIGAALMIQTFLTLRPTNPGFDPAGKVSILIKLPGETPEASERFFSGLFDRLNTIPGIRAWAASTYIPMRGTTRRSSITFNGTTAEVNTARVTPGYFEMMKIGVVSGRTFDDHDTSGSAPVAIVNEVFARRIRPDGQVTGQPLTVGSSRDRPPIERQIVGVVANTRFVGSHTRPANEVYVPYAQSPLNVLHVIVQSDGRSDSEAAASVRASVRALRPDLPVEPFESLPSLVSRRVMRWRFGAWLLGVFAAIAVGLAAIGLMTTIGWWVRMRTRELGVRIALGATRRQIVRLVLGHGLALGAAGIGAGCLAAAGATRYMRGWLYGITPLDPTTFTLCAAVMLVVAAGALYVPVRRATTVDPVVALRAE